MLYIVPIEPLEERYSSQWLDWTCRKMGEQLGKGTLKTNWKFILPTEGQYDKIENGAFLDVIGTNVYKNKQMEEILHMFQMQQIKNGDIFWFHDLWFPGLEMLFYIRDALGIHFKICGCLHAGTYDPYDYLTQKGMDRWGRHLERCWFQEVDHIFVATNFHRDLLMKDWSGPKNPRIHVTGFPIYPDTFVPGGRTRTPNVFPNDLSKLRIVFPHRLNNEKNPHLFAMLQDLLAGESGYENVQFIRTKELCKTKKEYYETLQSCHIAVSFANQETWGIAMQEAVFCGCMPIVPNHLSYTEMYRVVLPQMTDTSFLYDTAERRVSNPYDVKRVVQKIVDMTKNFSAYNDIWHPMRYGLELAGKNALDRMLSIMGVI